MIMTTQQNWPKKNRFALKRLALMCACLIFCINIGHAAKTSSQASGPSETQTTNTSEINEETAEEYWYKIELLIFAYVNTGDENSELWPHDHRPDFTELKTKYHSHDILSIYCHGSIPCNHLSV